MTPSSPNTLDAVMESLRIASTISDPVKKYTAVSAVYFTMGADILPALKVAKIAANIAKQA